MTTHAVSARPAGNRFTNFFSGIWAELKKVVWLTRREVTYLTLLVLIVGIAAAVVLGLCDYGFSNLVDKIFIAK